VRLLAVRVLASFCALTWLVFPGFGLVDLSVTWDPDWPVVLEASWGVIMSVLVGGSFLAVAVRPRRTAPAEVTVLITLTAWLVAAVAGLEWPCCARGGRWPSRCCRCSPLQQGQLRGEIVETQ
jgi:hypothetical protein